MSRTLWMVSTPSLMVGTICFAVSFIVSGIFGVCKARDKTRVGSRM